MVAQRKFKKMKRVLTDATGARNWPNILFIYFVSGSSVGRVPLCGPALATSRPIDFIGKMQNMKILLKYQVLAGIYIMNCPVFFKKIRC